MRSSSTEEERNDAVNVDRRDTGNTELTPLDLTTVFPPNVVRAQLYREEPKLPRISMEGAKLIGTTSALYLKDIVERIAGIKEESPITDEGVSDSGIMVQCADIYKLVEQTETFLFLKKPLEECGVQEMIQKERTHMAEYKPPAKRKRAPSASACTAKKVVQSLKQPCEGLEETTSKGTEEQIIADEDDYD